MQRIESLRWERFFGYTFCDNLWEQLRLWWAHCAKMSVGRLSN